MSTTKYISLNVKGINNAVKRKKILSWFKKEKVNIALLQETHLTDEEHKKLKREWVGQVYYSSFSSSKRGVAILIKKNTPFTIAKTVTDTEGRYVIIRGYLYGENILIGCIYAPNVYLKDFYSKLLAVSSSFMIAFSILAGDFNCTMDAKMDQSPPARSSMRRM